MDIDKIGGSLINTAGNIWGTVYTNRANREEARLNRAFQQEMSSTAHVRAMRDLEAAGLNPMLAVHSGASTPGGAQAHVQSPTQDMMGSAFAAMKMLTEMDSIEANTDRVNAEKEVIKAQLPGVAAQSETHVATADAVRRLAQLVTEGKEYDVRKQRDYAPNWKSIADSELGIKMAEARNEALRTSLLSDQENYESRTLEDRIESTKQELREVVLDNMAKDLDLPRRRAESKSWSGSYGQEVRPYIGDVGEALSGLSSASSAFRRWFGPKVRENNRRNRK